MLSQYICHPQKILWATLFWNKMIYKKEFNKDFLLALGFEPTTFQFHLLIQTSWSTTSPTGCWATPSSCPPSPPTPSRRRPSCWWKTATSRPTWLATATPSTRGTQNFWILFSVSRRTFWDPEENNFSFSFQKLFFSSKTAFNENVNFYPPALVWCRRRPTRIKNRVLHDTNNCFMILTIASWY